MQLCLVLFFEDQPHGVLVFKHKKHDERATSSKVGVNSHYMATNMWLSQLHLEIRTQGPGDAS